MRGSCLNLLVLRAGLTSIMALASLQVLIGCATNQNAALDSAIRDYEASRYKQAYDAAWLVRRSATGVEREEAAYVAGISAMKMDRPVTARELLEEAASSSNRRVAGTSSVTLATLLLEDGEPLAAARTFDKAAASLSGSESIKASRAAAAAYRSAGRADIAEARLSGTPEPSSEGNGLFTIQAGAFHDKSRATSRARELSTAARGTPLGTARIVPSTVKGKPGFLVQIGRYTTRTDAESMRRQLGVSGTFIARAATSPAG